jgi:hypothetical protein
LRRISRPASKIFLPVVRYPILATLQEGLMFLADEDAVTSPKKSVPVNKPESTDRQ